MKLSILFEIRSLHLFETWKDEDLKEIARGGRNMEYLCDKVIEEDSTNSEFVYIIVKVSFIHFFFSSLRGNCQRESLFKTPLLFGDPLVTLTCNKHLFLIFSITF